MLIGLIVNPVAGLGGPLALKGSDGDLATLALANGAVPRAGDRAAQALLAIGGRDAVTLVTCAGAMGADAAQRAGLAPVVIFHPPTLASTAADTVAAAAALVELGVDLLLFSGGDGTARDILAAVGQSVPVLGIPAGVKMHSAVFAISPRAAGAMLATMIGRGGEIGPEVLGEVVDRDPATAAVRLFGALRTPAAPSLRQAAKATGPSADDAELEGACAAIARRLRGRPLVLVGPGATTLRIKQALGPGGTLLGVDVYAHGALLVADADAATIGSLGDDAELVVGIIGGQGFLLGRGNQQLAPAFLGRIGRDRLTIVASAAKLAALPEGRLLVDSGDTAVDEQMAGFLPVQTGARRQHLMRVVAA